MTRKRLWQLFAAVVMLGCGGAAVLHVALPPADGIATNTHGATLSCVKDLALGGGHTCVLFQDGRVQCYGDIEALGYDWERAWAKVRELPDPPPRWWDKPVETRERFSTVAAADTDTCGLSKKDSSVWCWGGETAGLFDQGTARLPARFDELGTDNLQIDVGSTARCVLKQDHSVWCEYPRTPRTPVQVLDDAQTLYVRNAFACAKMVAGEIQCWGTNYTGQLGRGTVADNGGRSWIEPAAPVLEVGTSIEQLWLAAVSACGITPERQLWCWGYSGDAQFGDGRFAREEADDKQFFQSTPQKIELGLRFRELAFGTATGCAITEDRSVWCWGGASAGQMLEAPSLVFKRGTAQVELEPKPRRLDALGRDNQRIWAGGGHFCVQKGDLSVWCWGFNGNKQVLATPEANYIAPLTRLPIVCPPD